MTNYKRIEPGAIAECRTPMAPLRSDASEAAQLETQILYGETCDVLASGDGDWIKVRIKADGYQGWTDRKHFSPLVQSRFHFLTQLITPVKTSYGKQFLPFGSMLTQEEIQKTEKTGKLSAFSGKNPVEFAPLFENAPYLWGGKSILGIDCSGYMQLIFKACGILLPRNASQQESLGDPVDFAHRQSGDLAFFANDKGKIIHVGIIDDEGIWHASGWVHHDRLTSEGIIHFETGIITHRLASIRRITT